MSDLTNNFNLTEECICHSTYNCISSSHKCVCDEYNVCISYDCKSENHKCVCELEYIYPYICKAIKHKCRCNIIKHYIWLECKALKHK